MRTRPQTDATSYLTLRYVMVSVRHKVGIGDTLVDAITDMAGATPPPDTENPRQQRRWPAPPGKGDRAKARRAAPEGAGRLRRRRPGARGRARAPSGSRLSHQARVEVAKALNLLQ